MTAQPVMLRYIPFNNANIVAKVHKFVKFTPPRLLNYVNPFYYL